MDSKMSRANKAKGSGWESDIITHARARNLDAEKQPKNGSRDSGDAVIRFPSFHLVIEAKNEKSINLSGYLEELRVELANYRKARPAITAAGVVLVKRRQHGVAKGYAVMEVEALYDLLELLTSR
jgi:hypothetical protein